jgi:predicted transcriptional regulator
MPLCEKCLSIIFENLSNYSKVDNIKILSALNKKSEINLEEIGLATQLKISQRRDAISRLIGSGFIVGRKDGNMKIFSLSESGKQLVEMIKTKQLEI